MSEGREIHVYVIGSDGTEVYAAHSEQEMRDWYRNLLGADPQCEEDLAGELQEIADIDTKFEFTTEGEKVLTSWRELARSHTLPTQLSTGYN